MNIYHQTGYFINHHIYHQSVTTLAGLLVKIMAVSVIASMWLHLLHTGSEVGAVH